ncbi:GNAT family N-acetyltransferase [Pontibacter amylolyticus]|uniref:BioF2-like acetyltransferase domain-containing protein n=1 Tax=Pontibacter amylolyticus TaxID=1424080 RepID=A0ABQ1W397_9BACT|nr:GNAT family N-acetyltransferase [Pontibacter amylolyticus]GGG12527.1 hypothetical protein GCM10011323_16200 [Pontibacter amylolyticus]
MIQTQTHENLSTVSTPFQKMVYTPEECSQTDIEILVGTVALDALEDVCFTAQWEQLCNDCEWGTVFQSKGFVSVWYTLYQNQYIPIILRSFQDGKLTGLLTVTKKKGCNTIHVAGVRDAHYQVWLADKDFGDAFIKNAIKALRREFPSHEITFYNTPPQTPLKWATQDPAWRCHCTIRAFRRPLMDFRDPSIMNVINSKRFRKRYNQLKKTGNFEFEHVTTIERFSQVLDVLADQFDFRKAAKYNWLEFRVDPFKKKFLLKLFELGILHVTLLTLNGNIIASIIDTIGNNKWIHGSEIATHCCRHAKYSPGILNFLLLGQELLRKGYHIYDLTPGNDPYKERLSNAYDYVHELKITGAWQTYFNNKIVLPLRAITKNTLIRSNLSSKEIRDKARLLHYHLKTVKPKALVSEVFSNIVSVSAGAITIPDYKTHLLPEIKSNNLSDLLNYEPSKGEKSRWAFIADAMHRFEKEEISFTLSRNGKLLFCCWLSKHHTLQNFELPDGSAVLSGLYYKNTVTMELKEILGNVASLIVDPTKTHTVFLATK